MSNLSVGKMGEKLACDYLRQNGYEIIECNKRFSRLCEIDIIANQKDTLVFVEVKTRKTAVCGSPFEAITPAKYQNIKKGLFMYLAQPENKYKKYRIDAVAITLYPELRIELLKNI